jgi:putative ABC transport system substrate-binding protein
MRRREFIALLGTSVVLPSHAAAQSGRKMARIGVLWHAGSAEEEREYHTVLVKAFGNLGYIEGKNTSSCTNILASSLTAIQFLQRSLSTVASMSS